MINSIQRAFLLVNSAPIALAIGAANITLATGSAPLIKDNVIYLDTFPGVIVGTGLSASDRQANYTALQAALDYANTNKLGVVGFGKNFEYDGGRIDPSDGSTNVGLQFRTNITYVNLLGCMFYQYSASHPVFTVGEGASTITRFVSYNNMAGANRTAGDANSRGVLIGNMSGCQFSNITISRYNATQPAKGMAFFGTSGFFSNTADTVRINAGTVNIADFSVATGTGNHWRNTYFGGGGQPGASGFFGLACSGPAVNMANAGTHNKFDQMNIEWVSAPTILNIQNTFGTLIDTLHTEGCAMTGSSPTFISVYGQTRARIRSWQALNTDIRLTANGGTVTGGTVRWVQLGSNVGASSSLVIEALNINTGQTTGYGSAAIASVLAFDNGGISSLNSLRITQCTLIGAVYSNSTAPISFDAGLPAATYGYWSSFETYVYRKGRSMVDQITINAVDADVTLWGAFTNARVVFTVPITADRSVLIKNTVASSGVGSSQPRLGNDEIRIGRSAAATGAFNVNVKKVDGTTTLTSLSAATSEAIVLYNGTDASLT